ncbi:MAG: LysM peptidoglycan-binding domain-containing protein [Chloroflexota bacterium]|nr:LysM peptidoglycan-binding domain-containing protein [Chloroflexota bacterium]
MAEYSKPDGSPSGGDNEQGFVDDLRHSLRHTATPGQKASGASASRPTRRAEGFVPTSLRRPSRKWLLGILPLLFLAVAGVVLQLGPGPQPTASQSRNSPVAQSASGTPTPAAKAPAAAPTSVARSATPTAAARPAPARKPGTAKPAPSVREKVASAVANAADKARAGISGAVRSVRDTVQSVAERGKQDSKPQKPAAASTPDAAQGKAAQERQAKPRRAPRPIGEERTVVWGDTLRNISREHYGDEMLWPLIWDYNKERARQKGQNLENPDLIYPGWTFLLPEKE